MLLVLLALKNNDNPTPNKGVEILFGYSAESSQIKNEEGLTPKEYAEFLKETEYKVLFDHEEVVSERLKLLALVVILRFLTRICVVVRGQPHKILSFR